MTKSEKPVPKNGYKAFENGNTRKANPHPRGSSQCKQWNADWREADYDKNAMDIAEYSCFANENEDRDEE